MDVSSSLQFFRHQNPRISSNLHLGQNKNIIVFETAWQHGNGRLTGTPQADPMTHGVIVSGDLAAHIPSLQLHTAIAAENHHHHHHHQSFGVSITIHM